MVLTILRHGGGVAAAIAAAAFVVGCGDDDTAPAPREAAGPAKQVGQVVSKLERAVQARDFATICDDLLTSGARERAGGAKCASAMATSSAGLRRPRIRVLSIRIAGRRAEAEIRSSAEDQVAVEETLQLERRGDGYRIASLGR